MNKNERLIKFLKLTKLKKKKKIKSQEKKKFLIHSRCLYNFFETTEIKRNFNLSKLEYLADNRRRKINRSLKDKVKHFSEKMKQF